MSKEKIKVEIYTNENRYYEDIADEILKDNDKKEIVNILKRNFDLEDCLLNLKDLAEYQTKKLKQVLNGSDK